jgi:hypothetical protein
MWKRENVEMGKCENVKMGEYGCVENKESWQGESFIQGVVNITIYQLNKAYGPL